MKTKKARWYYPARLLYKFIKAGYAVEFKKHNKKAVRLEELMGAEKPKPKERKCRVCGCTNERGCPGGCWWVGPDLCSSCVEEADA